MVESINITRDDLARICGNDQRIIRAFENLLVIASETNPNAIEELGEEIEEVSIDAARVTPKPQNISVDSISFDNYAPQAGQVGDVGWNSDEDTLNITHKGGVTQQVGLEQYVRARNDTGTTITNGTLVGFSGVSGDIQIEEYIANGSMPSVHFIGVCTQDLDNGVAGKVTTFGKVRELDTSLWASGDTIYADPNAAGALTNVRPTAPDLVIVVGFVIVSSATVGEILVRPAFSQLMAYGSFSSDTDITPAAADTAYPIELNNTDDALSTSLGTPASRIVVSKAGRYSVSIGAEVTSSNASSKDVSFWIRKNGTDISATRRDITLTGNAQKNPFSISYEVSLAEDNYIEIVWASSSTAVELSASPATAYSPSASSIAVDITQVQL